MEGAKYRRFIYILEDTRMREIISVTKKYFKNRNYVSGRTSRRDFWIGLFGSMTFGLILELLMIAVLFLLANISVSTNMNSKLEDILLLLLIFPFLLYEVEAIWAFMTAKIRRLHDSGIQGFLSFLDLLFPVGTIVLLVLLCRDSDENNRYGDSDEQV